MCALVEVDLPRLGGSERGGGNESGSSEKRERASGGTQPGGDFAWTRGVEGIAAYFVPVGR